jgi:hypothetical protein
MISAGYEVFLICVGVGWRPPFPESAELIPRSRLAGEDLVHDFDGRSAQDVLRDRTTRLATLSGNCASVGGKGRLAEPAAGEGFAPLSLKSINSLAVLPDGVLVAGEPLPSTTGPRWQTFVVPIGVGVSRQLDPITIGLDQRQGTPLRPEAVAGPVGCSRNRAALAA